MARSLGLKGYVRNLPSGDIVEVEAEGEKQQMERLVQYLKIGPEMARVEQTEIRWSNSSGQFSDFTIRH